MSYVFSFLVLIVESVSLINAGHSVTCVGEHVTYLGGAECPAGQVLHVTYVGFEGFRHSGADDASCDRFSCCTNLTQACGISAQIADVTYYDHVVDTCSGCRSCMGVVAKENTWGFHMQDCYQGPQFVTLFYSCISGTERENCSKSNPPLDPNLKSVQHQSAYACSGQQFPDLSCESGEVIEISYIEERVLYNGVECPDYSCCDPRSHSSCSKIYHIDQHVNGSEALDGSVAALDGSEAALPDVAACSGCQTCQGYTATNFSHNSTSDVRQELYEADFCTNSTSFFTHVKFACVKGSGPTMCTPDKGTTAPSSAITPFYKSLTLFGSIVISYTYAWSC